MKNHRGCPWVVCTLFIRSVLFLHHFLYPFALKVSENYRTNKVKVEGKYFWVSFFLLMSGLFLWDLHFLTAILHRGLMNRCFFFFYPSFTFSNFYLDLYFIFYFNFLILFQFFFNSIAVTFWISSKFLIKKKLQLFFRYF